MLIVNRRVTSADAVARRARAASTRAAPGRRGRAGGASRRAAGSSSAAGRARRRGRRATRPSARTRRRRPSRTARSAAAPARGSSSGSCSERPSRYGDEVAVLRVHLVAVPRELELAHDRRRHEADDVRERGDLEVRAPRLLGGRRAADLRAPFEHRDARAALREQPGGDEAVVPAADDDDVEAVVRRLTAATCSSSGPPGRRARAARASRILGALVGAAQREDRVEVGIRGERGDPDASSASPWSCSVSMLRGLSCARYSGSVATR